MLKIATVNLNGLRASIRKGFLNWLDNYDADIVCLQEIRVAEKEYFIDREEHHFVFHQGAILQTWQRMSLLNYKGNDKIYLDWYESKLKQ